MPSSSLVEVEVKVGVEVGVEVDDFSCCLYFHGWEIRLKLKFELSFAKLD